MIEEVTVIRVKKKLLLSIVRWCILRAGHCVFHEFYKS